MSKVSKVCPKCGDDQMQFKYVTTDSLEPWVKKFLLAEPTPKIKDNIKRTCVVCKYFDYVNTLDNKDV